MNKKTLRILKYVFFILLANALCLHAAQAADLFIPQEGGLATKYALPLFDSETSPFKMILIIFDSATVLFGGCLSFYHIVIGTAATAHDGEMLGKKWSSMFTPIRMIYAVVFMIPMNNGFSPIQSLVHQAGLQGSGLADSIWLAYTPTALTGNSYVPPETNEKIKDLLKNTVSNAVCVAMVNKKINKIVEDGYISYIDGVHTQFGPKYFVKAGSDGSRLVGYNWGNVSQPTNSFPSYTYNSCGTTKLAFDTPNFDPETNTTSLVDLKALAAAMQNVQIGQMNMLVKEAQTIGNRIVFQRNYSSDDAEADMLRVSNAYANELKSEAKKQFEKFSYTDGVKMAQQDGWMGAGAWALKISNTVSSANALVNNLPRSEFGENDTQTTFINVWDNSIFAAVGGSAATFEQGLKKDPTSPKSRSGSNDAYSQQLISYFVQSNKDSNGVAIDYYSTNPMVVFASWGDNFLSMANGAAAVATTSSVVSAIPFFGNILTTIAAAFGTAFSMMFWAVIIPGLYLSYFVQMIPFFQFTVAVVMWYILMAEALFASQLWIMMFNTADEGSFIGAQRPGVNLMFSLLVRPALYIIGTIIAISSSTSIFGFINTHYINLLANAGSGDHYLWQQLGYGYGYIMIIHTVMMKLWQLPLELPEHIESWMNVQGSGSVASLKGAAQETMQGTQQLSHASLPVAGAMTAFGAQTTQKFSEMNQRQFERNKEKEANDKANTSSASNGDNKSEGNNKPDTSKDISKFEE
ncbi:DotA/TraY family protein [Pantoea eucrina]|uniref:DotA/TraY family protein n=1 Tax=Pantoea eucrina TaxID=472693 RepID=UPI000A23AB61|nr:DotA/TraY family protein [Pantoea eucrina]ORM76487.1 hypothetical protein HA43_14755 [Pantoea eucrina]